MALFPLYFINHKIITDWLLRNSFVKICELVSHYAFVDLSLLFCLSVYSLVMMLYTIGHFTFL